jgi:hypothetical protein
MLNRLATTRAVRAAVSRAVELTGVELRTVDDPTAELVSARPG